MDCSFPGTGITDIEPLQMVASGQAGTAAVVVTDQ